MTNTPEGTAWIDGAFMPIAEATLPVLDWGLLRSDATYDVVHVWRGRFFRLGCHVERFLASVRSLRLTLPVDRGTLERILAECVTRSGFENAYVEMVLTRGVSPRFSRDPRDAVNRLICFAVPFGWILRPEDRETGLDAVISDMRRIPPGSVDPRVKNYHWLDLVMGLYEAYDRGAGSVILSDGAGNVTEGPGFNLFVVSGGRIATPGAGVLQGITRQSVIEIARAEGIVVEERPVSAAEVLAADEVFASSTAGGVMPLTRIDGQSVGDGRMGPLTRRLTEAYWARHSDPAWSVAVADVLAAGELQPSQPQSM